MSKKKAINFDLSEIADGGVQVKLNRAKKKELTIPCLQRTFKIGYNRANQLLTQCEQVISEVGD